MKIAIVGSRDYPDLDQVRHYVMSLPTDTVIVSGGAKGVDTIAELTALGCGMAVEIYKPDWPSRKFKSFAQAAYARNETIVKAADRVVAFHYNHSPGTAHSIKLAKRHGKALEVFEA